VVRIAEITSAEALRLEGPPSAEHFIDHGAETEDVTAAIQLFAAHLLRRHVGHRAHHHSRYAQHAPGLCVIFEDPVGVQEKSYQHATKMIIGTRLLS